MKNSASLLFNLILFVFLVGDFFAKTVNIADNSLNVECDEDKFVSRDIQISFESTLPQDIFASKSLEHVSWSISGNNFLKDGSGEIIKDFKFDKPGDYVIKFNFDKSNHEKQDTECIGLKLPNQINLKVNSYKMNFLFDQAIFTKTIIGGEDLIGSSLEIPVFFESYDDIPFEAKNLTVISAGVGTTIQGKLVNSKIILNQGQNKLIFKLKGSATKNSYIMFDFLDVNNQIQSFAYPTKIN